MLTNNDRNCISGFIGAFYSAFISASFFALAVTLEERDIDYALSMSVSFLAGAIGLLAFLFSAANWGEE